jgi:uncharacterized damage-inducible protein DinB
MTNDDAKSLCDRLNAAARDLTYLLIPLDAEELRAVPDDGGWSAGQIMAHVKAGDDIITARVAMLLTHPGAVFQDFDVDAWALIADYAHAPADDTLMALQRHRAELVRALRALPDEAWQIHATHETRGDLTLRDLVLSFVAHEEEHIAQLRDLLGEDDEEEE